MPFDVIRPAIVALRKESVDRNISTLPSYSIIVNVALRKESVDRNPVVPAELVTLVKSLSARRAWIEIILFVNLRVVDGVALRKESVDRNVWLLAPGPLLVGRSPQGERG